MQKLMLIILLFISFTVHAQVKNFYVPSQKTNLQETGLNGEVKYFYTSKWKTEIKFGEPVKEKFTEKREWYFNKKGLYEAGSFETDQTRQKVLYKFSYNKNEQLEEAVRTINGQTEYTIKFLYNAGGNIIERNSYDMDNNLEAKEKYKYGSDGALQSITRYSGDGKLTQKKEYKWNAPGQLAEEKVYNEENEQTEITNTVYDRAGNISSVTRVNTGYEIVMKYKDNYTYNSKNQLEKKSMDVNSSTGDYKYEYDSYGNVVKQMVRYGGRGDYKIYQLYTYTYDSKGNWLTKLIEGENFSGEKEFTLEEREITYW